MESITPDLVKLVLFVLIVMPVAYRNHVTSKITNRSNIAVLLSGMAVAALVQWLAGQPISLPVGTWALTAAGILALFVVSGGGLNAGVAKFFIALVPWFSLSTYLMVVVVGCLVTAVVAKLGKGSAQIAPPVFATGLLFLLPGII